MPPTARQHNHRKRRLPLDGAGGELATAAVLVGLGVIALLSIGSGLDWAMPRALAVIAFVLGAAIAVRAVLGKQTAAGTGGRATRSAGTVDLAVFLTASIVYVIAIPLIGLWLVTLAMLTLVSFYLNERKDRAAFTQSVVVAVATCLVGYVVFRHVLFVPVPSNQWTTALLSPLGL